jgi:DNA-binding MarR family transcriptional regulator
MIHGPWPDKLLAILHDESNLGAGLTVRQVARRLQCSTSQAARFLSSRVKDGLVRRERGAYGYHYYPMDDTR